MLNSIHLTYSSYFPIQPSHGIIAKATQSTFNFTMDKIPYNFSMSSDHSLFPRFTQADEPFPPLASSLSQAIESEDSNNIYGLLERRTICAHARMGTIKEEEEEDSNMVQKRARKRECLDRFWQRFTETKSMTDSLFV